MRAKHVDDSALVAGVNDRVQLAELGAELNRRIVAAHQRGGVTVVDPATTWIDVDVTIGRDTVIHPGTQLLGSHPHRRRAATIGPDTTLTDVIRRRRRLGGPHARQRSRSIGDGAVVGPFAYLRPGTVLGADGKLGAFVETKNATIGTGTKVPHLTYVGDADIGEHSNIGASSVFVNYDGENKTPHHDWLARADRFRHHVRRTGHGRRRRLHRRGHGGARGRAAGCAGGVGGSAAQHRGLGGAQAARISAPRRPPARRSAKPPNATRQTDVSRRHLLAFW